MSPLDATVDHPYAAARGLVAAVPRRRSRFGSSARREHEIARLETHLAQTFAALAAGAPYPSADPRGAHAHLCDEPRIMRLRFTCGPQPGTDIGKPKPLTLVGREAGCRVRSQVDSYLEDLRALGLVAFSRSALPDERRYAALEIQREVAAAHRHVDDPSARRRSFGADSSRARVLCRRCSIGVRPPDLVELSLRVEPSVQGPSVIERDRRRRIGR
jgi:hypothetical protein